MFDFLNCDYKEALEHLDEIGERIYNEAEYETGIHMPKCARDFGFPDIEPIVNQYVLYKMTASRRDIRFRDFHPHNLTKEMITQAFAKASSPIAIVNVNNSIFILTNALDGNGDPIGIAIKHNSAQHKNYVCSCYGRNSFVAFLALKMRDNLVIQCNQKKLMKLIHTVYQIKIEKGLALPEDEQNALNLIKASIPDMKKTLADIKKNVEAKRTQIEPVVDRSRNRLRRMA